MAALVLHSEHDPSRADTESLLDFLRATRALAAVPSRAEASRQSADAAPAGTAPAAGPAQAATPTQAAFVPAPEPPVPEPTFGAQESQPHRGESVTEAGRSRAEGPTRRIARSTPAATAALVAVLALVLGGVVAVALAWRTGTRPVPGDPAAPGAAPAVEARAEPASRARLRPGRGPAPRHG